MGLIIAKYLATSQASQTSEKIKEIRDKTIVCSSETTSEIQPTLCESSRLSDYIHKPIYDSFSVQKEIRKITSWYHEEVYFWFKVSL
jgi:hypothetical protein